MRFGGWTEGVIAMTVTVSVEEASSNLPELLSRLSEDTAEIIIAKDGSPVARLLPAPGNPAPQPSRRVAGSDAGSFCVPEEFFDPLPDEVLASFYGGSREP
jgi:antitoxin (DNA-binding transcriptional repressor) of toxin-antitoxin stability system